MASRNTLKASWLGARAHRFAASLVFLAATSSVACKDDAPADDETEGEQDRVSRVAEKNDPATPSPSATAQPSAQADAPPPPAADQPYDGPWLGAMAFQTPIYPEPRFSDKRLGYIRQGGKVPVDPKPIKKGNCKEGWYRLLDGGYVCGKYSTLDLENPRVRLGVKQPDVEALVPYKYAYNRFHGTPLYKALPTKEEMNKYEPYLLEEKRKKEKEKAEAEAAKNEDKSGAGGNAGSEERRKGKHPVADDKTVLPGGAVPATDDAAAKDTVAAMSTLDAGAPESPEEAQNPPQKPWWQSDEKDPQISLSDLEQDADGNLAKRMVKGFFVAVDKNFSWNGRSWFRTTNGLVAPSDRMWINKPPESKGIAYPEKATAVFFVLGDKAKKYEVKGDKVKETGKLARYAGFGLTGKSLEVEGATYRETLDGFWVKSQNGAITEAGARPSDVGEKEKWVDVDLSSKTLLLFEGDKPVYAALMSPGKHSRNKKKDHSTPTGAWRVREKHIAVTMDGDGASGDLPYSIDDVPYVAYFSGSYALHGAFWHSNFGREMSHGCVNLSPADAKHVFAFVEPTLPRGWHAVWASDEKRGSMIVVHD